MGACYSATMRQCHPFSLPNPARWPPLWPTLWLVSDARNDAGLERAIKRLPRGSGLIFRHYHLPPQARRARFAVLARAVRARGGVVVLGGDMALARRWGADGAYGAPGVVGPGGCGLRLLTAHSLREITLARRVRGDALLLSPAFATRSHPDSPGLGVMGWRTLAQHGGRGGLQMIALGGMDAARARHLGARAWAAIDGLSQARKKCLDHSRPSL